MGSTPAPGVASRRPRRVAGPRAESLNGESVRGAQKVTGEGASHGARGGRTPPPQYGSGLGWTEYHSFLTTPGARCPSRSAVGRAVLTAKADKIQRGDAEIRRDPQRV